MLAAFNINQAYRYPYPLSKPPDLSFKNMLNSQLTPDLKRIDALCIVGKTRAA